VLAIVLLSDPQTSKRERVLLIPATVLMCYAIMLTGARSSFMILALGVFVIAWYRRNFQNFVIIPLAIYLALKLAASSTGGAAAERYSTLLKVEDVMARVFFPTSAGFSFMMDNPFGGG